MDNALETSRTDLYKGIHSYLTLLRVRNLLTRITEVLHVGFRRCRKWWPSHLWWLQRRKFQANELRELIRSQQICHSLSPSRSHTWVHCAEKLTFISKIVTSGQHKSLRCNHRSAQIWSLYLALLFPSNHPCRNHQAQICNCPYLRSHP